MFTHTCTCMGTQDICAQTLDTQAWTNGLLLHLCTNTQLTCAPWGTHVHTDTKTRVSIWNLMHKHILMHMRNYFSQTPLSGYRSLCTCWAHLHPSISTRIHTAPRPAKLNAHISTTYACMYECIINVHTHRHKHTMHIFTHAGMHSCVHTHTHADMHTQLPFEALIHQPCLAGNCS